MLESRGDQVHSKGLPLTFLVKVLQISVNWLLPRMPCVLVPTIQQGNHVSSLLADRHPKQKCHTTLSFRMQSIPGPNPPLYLGNSAAPGPKRKMCCHWEWSRNQVIFLAYKVPQTTASLPCLWEIKVSFTIPTEITLKQEVH